MSPRLRGLQPRAASLPTQVLSPFGDATNQPDGQITENLSSPLTKNIPLSPSGKSALPARAISPDERGGSRSSRTWVEMRWTRMAAKDERRYRVRRSRVVLTPRRWCQVLERRTLLGGDGDKKARSPGRARYKP